MVVGGGPGGMQAAVISARRGHKVTLYEADKELGGTLQVACLPPYKIVLRDLTGYLARQLKKHRVETRLCVRVTAEKVQAESPDVVVLATGGKPSAPEIPGIEDAKVVQAIDVLTGRSKVGRRVVVLGGGETGCETAEFLRQRGHEVTVVTTMAGIASAVGPSTRPLVLEKLTDMGIATLAGAKCERIDVDGVVVRTKEGERCTIMADSVVLAKKANPDKELFQALEGQAREMYLIGDCSKPGRIIDATEGGAMVGLTI
ncbi:MAG: FAD-dependent oxidoreductase, partial [Dehalococcoidia bacterium]|nr:FAD-dependent oxidoreductase [Dehalococcoidia bacterium]